ncbi:hypothetical protein FQN57_002648 [Myotisia sp. PD_48]|nr:hypothetical protein FQN57_002648 [Myotisia sp. PD_48]
MQENDREMDPEDNECSRPPASSLEANKDILRGEETKQSSGVLKQLYLCCVGILGNILQKLLSSTALSPDDKKRLRRCYGSLRLWGDDHNVSDGELDLKLLIDDHLQKAVSKYLLLVGEVLSSKLLPILDDTHRLVKDYERAKHILQLDSQSSHGRDFDSHNLTEPWSDTDDLDESICCLETYSECLIDLNPALEIPAGSFNLFEERPAPPLQQIPAYAKWAELITAKFPSAEPQLVEFLSQIHHQRFIRLFDMRNSKETDNLSSEKNAASSYRDSGLGSSVPSRNLSEGTVISRAVTAFRSLETPKLPDVAKEGKYFTCDACSKMLHITEERDWRIHLFHDIRPYSCIFPDCAAGTLLFKSREMWITHLEEAHHFGPGWEERKCPLCVVQIGPGRYTIANHIGEHLEEISLSAYPRSIEDDSDSSPSASIINGIPPVEDEQTNEAYDSEAPKEILLSSRYLQPGFPDGKRSPTA